MIHIRPLDVLLELMFVHAYVQRVGRFRERHGQLSEGSVTGSKPHSVFAAQRNDALSSRKSAGSHRQLQGESLLCLFVNNLGSVVQFQYLSLKHQ